MTAEVSVLDRRDHEADKAVLDKALSVAAALTLADPQSNSLARSCQNRQFLCVRVYRVVRVSSKQFKVTRL